MAGIRAFVVRPFGTKEGIDFEKIDRELIEPALAELAKTHDVQVSGGTTQEVIRQGNIRKDMFQRLVSADLVIADVSIDNANAYYELGIRHGLQDRWTFLMRADPVPRPYPFDLQTDRYFSYDPAQPAARVGEMADALRSTLASNEKNSPVFLLLPKLKPQPRSDLITIPAAFREDVERARSAGQRGDLRLLAYEVQGLEWQTEGLRLVGEAQFKLKAFRGARDSFEALRRFESDDLQANQRLATIYQRLARGERGKVRADLLTRSDQAIQRALDVSDNPSERAEGYSLLGSNAKARWIDEIGNVDAPKRPAQALRSPHLDFAVDGYLRALRENLDAHYPAVNTLGLLRAQSELAKKLPEVWQAKFDDARAAQDALRRNDQAASRITALLQLALGVDELVGRPASMDAWAAGSKADLLLVTVADNPERVAEVYRRAITGADQFTIEAIRRNVEIFRDLGLFEANVSASLGVIDDALAGTTIAQAPRIRVVLFTGHMVDAPDRPKDKMRFPPTAKAEATARKLIDDALAAELAEEGGVSIAIAGGACGSDILFHEACLEKGIKSQLHLALPQAQFLATSVQRGGPQWVERYRKLCGRLETRVLQEIDALPDWLVDKPGYDLWQRNNLWMMFDAIATAAPNLTLIALYNAEREADGPGGTEQLVRMAKDWGFKTVPLDARALLDD
jgi:hypothetical protein